MNEKKKDSLTTGWEAVLNETLSGLYSGYPKDISALERRKTDWELCNRGVFAESDLLVAYAKSTGVSVMEDEEVNSADIKPFPEMSNEFIDNFCCLPFRWDDESADVLVADPYFVDKIRYMFRNIYGKKTLFQLTRRSTLERKIKVVYSPGDEIAANPVAFTGSGYAKEGPESEEALRSLASETTIVRFVNEMFSRALELDASDIHVEPEENRMTVRFRVDGMLQEIMTVSLSQYPAVASRIKLIGGLNIAERRLPQDGRTNFKIGKSDFDVRISTIPTINGESIVLRLLKKDASIFDLERLGMSDEIRVKFEKLITLPHGIILVVGPTGSGKTTTLYSVIRQLNTSDRKIITIEDPIEYRMERLSQIQVNPKIGLDFASGLRHIVRQDPDVILVGEIRDRETAEIAVHASLTGHLVLSTLHTNDAVGAITRLLDLGVEGFLISSSLKAVLSQRLIRKICPDCLGGGGISKCKKCGGTGYKGRTGIFEVLRVDEEIGATIARKKDCDSSTIFKLARKNGMKTLLENGQEKIESGITTKDEIARVTINI